MSGVFLIVQELNLATNVILFSTQSAIEIQRIGMKNLVFWEHLAALRILISLNGISLIVHDTYWYRRNKRLLLIAGT